MVDIYISIGINYVFPSQVYKYEDLGIHVVQMLPLVKAV